MNTNRECNLVFESEYNAKIVTAYLKFVSGALRIPTMTRPQGPNPVEEVRLVKVFGLIMADLPLHFLASSIHKDDRVELMGMTHLDFPVRGFVPGVEQRFLQGPGSVYVLDDQYTHSPLHDFP